MTRIFILSRTVLLGLLLSTALFPVSGQILRDYYNQTIKPADTPGTLSLSVNASTFFNNNEFFDTNEEGYTLTGAFFQPVIIYNVSGNLSFGTGIHLLKYNGRDEFARIMPVFRIDYLFSPRFRITMGSFNGGEAFLLPEPLYKFENHFTELLNNGIRLDYKSNDIRSLTWINWEHFILPGDTLQEQFTFGSTDFFTLYNRNRFHITLPLHFVVHHQGGQINITDQHVISTLNLAAGLRLDWSFGDNRDIYFNPMFFYDADNETSRNGTAWYPQAGLKFKPLEVTAGYFRGNKFQTIHGEQLFFSPVATPADPGLNEIRSLVTFKAGIARHITSTSSILLRFEGYYDTAIRKLQYTYGLHIVLDEGFFLKKSGEAGKE